MPEAFALQMAAHLDLNYTAAFFLQHHLFYTVEI